jgi:hypothetical protein
MKLCQLIRETYNEDRMFCLYPDRCHDGLTQAYAVSLPYGININLAFFSEKYEVQVWVGGDDVINYQPGNHIKRCFYFHDFMRHLLRNNDEAACLLLYALFLRALRMFRSTTVYAAAAYAAADAAAYAADAAAADAADAAAYAADAAANAANAADAAYAANAANAADAYAAAAAANAADAAYAAYAANVADAYEEMKKAFKYLIRYRKREV